MEPSINQVNPRAFITRERALNCHLIAGIMGAWETTDVVFRLDLQNTSDYLERQEKAKAKEEQQGGKLDSVTGGKQEGRKKGKKKGEKKEAAETTSNDRIQQWIRSKWPNRQVPGRQGHGSSWITA